MFRLDLVDFHIAHSAGAGESHVSFPSLTSISISGNGLVPRAYEVVDHAGQTRIGPLLEVVLDDRQYVMAGYIVDSSV